MDNQLTGARIANLLTARNIEFEQKNMFGGVCFMVDEKMCLGSYKGGLMARINPEEVDMLSKRPGTEQMIHAGRTMVGYVFIEAPGFENDEDLGFWVDKCLAWNPFVKKSAKKKKK